MNTMNPTIETQEAQLYETCKETALRILNSGRRVEAVALYFLPDGEMALTPLPMTGPSAQMCRDTTRALLAIMAETLPCFCTVTECWMAKYDGTDAPPSERTDRTEAILVQCFTNGKRTCHALMTFSRKDGPVTHGDWQETRPSYELVKGAGSVFPA
jgi:hypothetical protein